MKNLTPTFRKKVDTENELWQALQLFNLYRFCLALGFWTLAKLNIESNIFRIYDELLYDQISLTYFLLSVLFLLVSFFIRRKYFLQANIPIFIDIVAIIIIMYACGGITSGIGILLIVIVAAHSLLLPGRLSFLSAALAAIGLIIEQTYSFFFNHSSLNLFTQVGLLGSVILISAFLTTVLSLRVRKDQETLKSQTQQLAMSQQLNAHIISAMREGVLVLDNQNQIRLINSSARQLLDFHSDKTVNYITDLPHSLQRCFHAWKTEGRNNCIQSILPSFPEVRFRFHLLGQGLPSGTLIFIYDAAEEARHAQDLKLASLGHLTANIAHELRNPLGTVSHAAQLLAESNSLKEEDQNLVSMIKLHSNRMNRVIQNVLSLSGRKQPNVVTIALIPWLEQFIEQLTLSSTDNPKITLEYQTRKISINVDPSQFTQILINLCENGLRYSLRNTGQSTLTLRLNTTSHPPTVLLDILDQGEGLPINALNHLFEPFFTTETNGSGLGLYLARELSLINNLRLDYCPTNTGCQFRLTIPLTEAI